MSVAMLRVKWRERTTQPRAAAAATPSCDRDRAGDAGGKLDGVLEEETDSQPSSRGFIALLEAYRATGGMAPANFLLRSLQEHQRGDIGQLARLIVERRIFVLSWRGDSWIPMFQFEGHDLSCKTAPALVRAELTGLDSGWAIANWFAQPNARLDGRRPVNALDSDLAAVLDVARSCASNFELRRPVPTHA